MGVYSLLIIVSMTACSPLVIVGYLLLFRYVRQSLICSQRPKCFRCSGKSALYWMYWHLYGDVCFCYMVFGNDDDVITCFWRYLLAEIARVSWWQRSMLYAWIHVKEAWRNFVSLSRIWTDSHKLSRPMLYQKGCIAMLEVALFFFNARNYPAQLLNCNSFCGVANQVTGNSNSYWPAPWDRLLYIHSVNARASIQVVVNRLAS